MIFYLKKYAVNKVLETGHNCACVLEEQDLLLQIYMQLMYMFNCYQSFFMYLFLPKKMRTTTLPIFYFVVHFYIIGFEMNLTFFKSISKAFDVCAKIKTKL